MTYWQDRKFLSRSSFCIILLFLIILINLWNLLPKSLPELPSSQLVIKLEKWNYLEEASPYLSPSEIFPFYEENDLKINENAIFNRKKCTMESCFNYERCVNGFRVYVYPTDLSVHMSSTYEKIINLIKSSHYYTENISEACLFVLSIDTLDRDALSRNFVRNVPSRLIKNPYWNNGENHVIFNLYAGTWPSYNETVLDFDWGNSILAKASMSEESFRPYFDISLPLFHPTHLEKGEEGKQEGLPNNYPPTKKHLISFKGKRYVYGIGSETRNSVYHLHNKKDVIMVTTCRHGKNWKVLKDERCDEDNNEYEKYDYETLLSNSTFCLIPRGRRLGSFRFLESLQSGCIPVIVSNGWILPFSEVIDWSSVSIKGDERNLLQMVELLRSISQKQIFRMRQQTQVIWAQYLGSLQKIIYTTFEIIRDRIEGHNLRDSQIWNSVPGGLSYETSYGDHSSKYPFSHTNFINSGLRTNFTAVIYVDSPPKLTSSNSPNLGLFRQVRNAARSKFISKILIIWDSLRPIPKSWPEIRVPFTIKKSTSKSASQRFVTPDEVETDAIISLDEKEILSTDEMNFAYSVWQSFPDRLIGYFSRSHYWDETLGIWRYSSKLSNEYSLLVGSGLMYHVYFSHLYWTSTPPQIHSILNSHSNCYEILLNVLISIHSHKPPLKITQKKGNELSNTKSLGPSLNVFNERQSCLNELLEIYGNVGFKRSQVRFDPILFRDPVSNLRKKYRQLEL